MKPAYCAESSIFFPSAGCSASYRRISLAFLEITLSGIIVAHGVRTSSLLHPRYWVPRASGRDRQGELPRSPGYVHTVEARRNPVIIIGTVVRFAEPRRLLPQQLQTVIQPGRSPPQSSNIEPLVFDVRSGRTLYTQRLREHASGRGVQALRNDRPRPRCDIVPCFANCVSKLLHYGLLVLQLIAVDVVGPDSCDAYFQTTGSDAASKIVNVVSSTAMCHSARFAKIAKPPPRSFSIRNKSYHMCHAKVIL